MRVNFIAICLVFLICPSVTSGQWSWLAGSDDSFDDLATAVAVDANGNTYGVGTFTNTLSLSGTTVQVNGDIYFSDAFIAKWDQQGNLKWLLNFGGPGLDEGTAVAVDNAGNIYMGGVFMDTVQFGNTTLVSAGQKDLFLAKLDSTGQVLWAKSFGGPGEEMLGVKVGGSLKIAPDQSVYFVGSFSGTFLFDQHLVSAGGAQAGFIAKLDSSGSVESVFTIGGLQHIRVRTLTVDSNYNVVIAGIFLGSQISFSSQTFWSPNAGFMVGTAYVAKINSSWNLEWAKLFGGSNTSGGTSGGSVLGGFHCIDNSGNIYLAAIQMDCEMDIGTAVLPNFGGSNAFLMKFNTQGGVEWHKYLHGPSAESVAALACDEQGNVYLAGYGSTGSMIDTDSLSINGGELFIAQLTSAGSLQGTLYSDGSSSKIASEIAVQDNNITLAGRWSGNDLVLGSHVLNSTTTSGWDVFFAKAATPTSVQSLPESVGIAIQLYPNPATDLVTVDAGKVQMKLIQVLSATGTVVAKQEVNDARATLNIQHLPSGNYFVRIQHAEGVVNERLQIVR